LKLETSKVVMSGPHATGILVALVLGWNLPPPCQIKEFKREFHGNICFNHPLDGPIKLLIKNIVPNLQ